MEDYPQNHPILKGLREILDHVSGRRTLPSEVITAEEIDGYRSGMNLDEQACPYSPGTDQHEAWHRGRQIAIRHYGSF